MANLQVIDGASATKYIKETGAGTNGDPFVPSVIIDSGTITLPTGASTAAKQPALGTAGTASADVLTVQGIASMTPLIAKIDQTTPGTTNATSLAQIGSTTVAANNGAPTAGTQRVTIADINVGDYETVAASATDQILGPTGAAGDYLAGLLIVPATTSPGAVSIKDGNGSGITVFTGGASSVVALVPFFVPLGIVAINATTPGWKVTTGTNVSAIGVGNFT